MKFVRFGNIKATEQKHFGSDTFHSPPVKKGFYAMPKEAQEFFLIGSIYTTQPHNFPKTPYYEKAYDKWEDEIKDIGWKVPIESYPEGFQKDSKLAEKKQNKRMRDIRSEFVLTNEQLIWHHLDNLPNNEILKRSGSWVLTRVKEYKKAFKKERARLKYNQRLGSWKHSKDDFEVFIEYNI